MDVTDGESQSEASLLEINNGSDKPKCITDEQLYHQTIEKLRDVPFLDLNSNLDVSNLVSDYENLLSNNIIAESYRTRYRLVRKYYAKSWSGVCLLSSDGNLYSDLKEGDVETDISEPKKTLAYDYCPYIAKVIDKISGDSPKSRARIMRIAPGRSLLWHSHVQEHQQPENILTVQIPIIVPKKFRYCVVHSDEFRWYKRLNTSNSFQSVQQKNLLPGSAYVFNSFHYHNVYNDDTRDYRITLMLYLDLRWKHVLYMVSNALEKQQVCDWNRYNYAQ